MILQFKNENCKQSLIWSKSDKIVYALMPSFSGLRSFTTLSCAILIKAQTLFLLMTVSLLDALRVNYQRINNNLMSNNISLTNNSQQVRTTDLKEVAP